MLKAVLFDLDGTLLDIDLESFLESYFSLLAPIIASIVDGDNDSALQAVVDATHAMHTPHAEITNRDAFNVAFMDITGVDLSDPAAAYVIERFYQEVFPTLASAHRPHPGGAEAVFAARRHGLLTVLATNPIFPLTAIVERLRWAGLKPQDFHHITSYETARACKPQPLYYRDIATALGVSEADCLMIGDDPQLDMAAADVGMRTFLIGDQPHAGADWTGGLLMLPALLERLVA